MTPEQTAMRAKAELQFTEKFERLGDPQARESAERCVAWLLREGWRPQPALADGPPPRRAEPSPRSAEYLAQIRQELEQRKATRR